MLVIHLAGIPCPICHQDGTVDYWCPRRQGYVRRASTVPTDALALMPCDEQARVQRHLWRALAVTCG